MQDVLSLLVCSNERTGLQVGIRYKIMYELDTNSYFNQLSFLNEV